MWNVLKRSDLAQAKDTLVSRREEMLRRHAEEIAQLEAEQAEVAELRRLAAAFCEKFHVVAPPARAAGANAVRQVAPAAREPWRGPQRGQPQSNFAVFSGALARAF